MTAVRIPEYVFAATAGIQCDQTNRRRRTRHSDLLGQREALRARPALSGISDFTDAWERGGSTHADFAYQVPMWGCALNTASRVSWGHQAGASAPANGALRLMGALRWPMRTC